MSVLDDLLEDAQPGYEPSVALILDRLRTFLGETAFAGLEKSEVAPRAIERLSAPGLDLTVKLQLMTDVSALAWWCGLTLGDAQVGALARLARSIFHEAARAIAFRVERPDPAALHAHAVFAGPLMSHLHSPSRGAIDYVAALARDPENGRIDVFHGMELSPSLAAYAAERLGQDTRVRFVRTDTNPDFLSMATSDGPCTFHVWCEPAFAIHISLLSLMGPTVMFTCADTAPAQFADVYWYCHEPAYIAELWARQQAPAGFIAGYRQTEACPFPQDPPAQGRTRADLGFGEDETILVTVGNRLGVDMDQAFVDGTGTLVLRNPGTHWVVVGKLQDFWVEAFGQVLGDQFTHIPYDDDLAGLLALADVFVNPFRPGGGTSAIMAVAAGCQVLTRGDLGDVGAFVPTGHRAPDIGTFFEILQNLVDDPAFRAARLAEQQALMARRLDQELFAEELKALNTLAYQRFAARLPVSLETVFAQAQPKRLALKGGRNARLR